mmetsp:Transcript_29509/g.91144  ORF Transcript_29509/g.91144 Transcript_29509/m.91144 type:complete len:630 (+) Transcript_29509:551-2440(+)
MGSSSAFRIDGAQVARTPPALLHRGARGKLNRRHGGRTAAHLGGRRRRVQRGPDEACAVGHALQLFVLLAQPRPRVGDVDVHTVLGVGAIEEVEQRLVQRDRGRRKRCRVRGGRGAVAGRRRKRASAGGRRSVRRTRVGRLPGVGCVRLQRAARRRRLRGRGGVNAVVVALLWDRRLRDRSLVIVWFALVVGAEEVVHVASLHRRRASRDHGHRTNTPRPRERGVIVVIVRVKEAAVAPAAVVVVAVKAALGRELLLLRFFLFIVEGDELVEHVQQLRALQRLHRRLQVLARVLAEHRELEQLRRRRALVGVDVDARADQLEKRHRGVEDDAEVRGVGELGDVLGQRERRVEPGDVAERRLAGRHLQNHHAQRPDVRFRVVPDVLVGVGGHALGGHVRRRPLHVVELLALLQPPRGAEVTELRAAIEAEQDVGRLDVAVDEALVVDVREPFDNVAQDRHHLLHRHLLVLLVELLEAAGEGPAAGELHEDVQVRRLRLLDRVDCVELRRRRRAAAHDVEHAGSGLRRRLASAHEKGVLRRAVALRVVDGGRAAGDVGPARTGGLVGGRRRVLGVEVVNDVLVPERAHRLDLVEHFLLVDLGADAEDLDRHLAARHGVDRLVYLAERAFAE